MPKITKRRVIAASAVKTLLTQYYRRRAAQLNNNYHTIALCDARLKRERTTRRLSGDDDK